jgi:ribonucleotide reductase beta subunit family protein with ferritin-like domain
MAMMFGSQETVHAVAYSYLNETLKLEDYEAFLHEPATAQRFDNLVAYDGTNPIGIGKSLAVFSAFAEGVSLYSAFAVLYSFQLRNLLKGIGQQMKWSVRDESLHSKMGCKLFRDMCSENDQLLHLCREDIIKAAETMITLETKYIDKMFEMGDIEGIKANDLKHFIKKRANEKLVELGYVDLGSLVTLTLARTSRMTRMQRLILIGSIILPAGSLILIFSQYGRRIIRKLTKAKTSTGGVTHTDFFAIRPTDYSKANEGEDFEDIW